jgi:hypothetical protein
MLLYNNDISEIGLSSNWQPSCMGVGGYLVGNYLDDGTYGSSSQQASMQRDADRSYVDEALEPST